MVTLNVFKTHPDVNIPSFQTDQSACFDIAVNLAGKTTFSGYSKTNSKFTKDVYLDLIYVMPGDRILIPTGLIFDIPQGYSIRLHPRSGLSLKNGLVLANSEGVIDSDYTNETFILMTNISENSQHIKNHDRIAQAELVKNVPFTFAEISTAPSQKTDRIGGMGSTGT